MKSISINIPPQYKICNKELLVFALYISDLLTYCFIGKEKREKIFGDLFENTLLDDTKALFYKRIDTYYTMSMGNNINEIPHSWLYQKINLPEDAYIAKLLILLTDIISIDTFYKCFTDNDALNYIHKFDLEFSMAMISFMTDIKPLTDKFTDNLMKILQSEPIPKTVTHQYISEATIRKSKKRNTKIISLTGIILLIIIVGIVISASNSSYTEIPVITKTPKPTNTPNPTLPPTEPMPETGYIFKYPENERIAPLSIDASSCSTNYYIYLKDYYGNSSNDMSFFVRSGEKYEFEIPLGSYKMYCCSGTDWYGTELKFGKYSYYSTSDDVWEFTETDEQVNGYTITLYPVTNGNMETKTIDESEFPG